MKLIHLFLLIFLWNTTYRCKKKEITIDCEGAAKKMIGRWEGIQFNYPKTFSDTFILTVTSSDGCHFLGETSYTQSTTTFNVSGNIDEYGWMQFNETNFIVDGGEYTSCTGSYWNACRNIRWQPGAKFNEFRFDEKSLAGEWEIACWRCDLDGGFTLIKE